ncbi:DUF2950 domain-containing protein [Pararobbsia silviterrae]|nr:DUF2950 domain-containing protein [Pararobbsia silviterrae]
MQVWLAAACASLGLFAHAARAQEVFPTPDAAAESLQQAVATQDDDALKKILGADYKRFVPNASEDDIYAFLSAYSKHHEIVDDGNGTAHLQAGDSGWTLPVPIRASPKGWHFDVRAAHDEMAVRRIGRNELAAIQTVLAIGDAQRDFAAAQGKTVYAARFVSRPGTHDGLYWPAGEGEPESPLGALASVMDPKAREGGGYHGYHYRILTAQGPSAPGGARSYVEDRAMSGGFAVIAWPVEYNTTGIMTFIAGSDGKVYQRNFGPQTTARVATIKAFDPSSDWTPVPDSQTAAQ